MVGLESVSLLEGQGKSPERPGTARGDLGYAGEGMMGREVFFSLAMYKVV